MSFLARVAAKSGMLQKACWPPTGGTNIVKDDPDVAIRCLIDEWIVPVLISLFIKEHVEIKASDIEDTQGQHRVS